MPDSRSSSFRKEGNYHTCTAVSSHLPEMWVSWTGNLCWGSRYQTLAPTPGIPAPHWGRTRLTFNTCSHVTVWIEPVIDWVILFTRTCAKNYTHVFLTLTALFLVPNTVSEAQGEKVICPTSYDWEVVKSALNSQSVWLFFSVSHNKEWLCVFWSLRS